MRTSALVVVLLCLFTPSFGRPVTYDASQRSLRVLLAVVSTTTSSSDDDVSLGSERRQVLRSAYAQKGADIKFIVSKHAAADGGWLEWESKVTNDIMALDARDAASDDGTVELLSNIHANARPRYDFVIKTTSPEPLDLSRTLSHLRSQPERTVYADDEQGTAIFSADVIARLAAERSRAIHRSGGSSYRASAVYDDAKLRQIALSRRAPADFARDDQKSALLRHVLLDL